MSELPSAADRSFAASIASHTRWSRCDDPSRATAPARAAFNARFEKQVDPDNTLAPDVRARMAEHARKAYFRQLARRSAQVRAARRSSSGSAAG